MASALALAGSAPPWRASAGTVDFPAERDVLQCSSTAQGIRQGGGIQERAGVASRIRLWRPLSSRLLECRRRLHLGLVCGWGTGIPSMESFGLWTGRGRFGAVDSRKVVVQCQGKDSVGSDDGRVKDEGGKEDGDDVKGLKDVEAESGVTRTGWLARVKLAVTGLLGYFPMLQLKVEEANVPREPTGASFAWEGWGTSLCWWANFAGGLPEEERAHILDLLFDREKGLGLNIARYNIGGGANMSFDTNMRPYGDIPGFKIDPKASYDWSEDERQRLVLFEAKSRGVNVLEAFSNSPPPWMTQSGSVTGNWRKGDDNLKSQSFSVFADYLVDVVEQYKTKWGIEFDYLAPFNEPVEGFWNIDRSKAAQEGCNFSVPSINKLILEVQKSISRKGLSTQITAADAWSMDTERVIKGLGQDAINAVSQINVHTYLHIPQRERDARRPEVRNLAKNVHGKRLWMSEYGPLGWWGRELDIALAVGRHITLDINDMQCSAWCYWQVVEHPPKNNIWGLLQTDFKYPSEKWTPFNVLVKKQYYIMLQFSRWIRPGFTIFASEGSFKDWLVMAVDSSTKATAVFVFTNTSDRVIDVNIDVSGIAPALKGSPVCVSMYRTSFIENHRELPTTVSESPLLTTRVLGRSVTTAVVTEAPPGSYDEKVATMSA